MLDGSVIVKVTEFDVPVGGTLPFPVHPVQMYCICCGPEAGEVTDAVMLVPLSNHPLVGLGESHGDDTVKYHCVL